MKQSIIDALTRERHLVRSTIATEAQDDLKSVPEWGALILRHAGLAMPHDRNDHADLQRLKKQMIRVMFAAMSCVESIERKEEKAKSPHPPPESRGRQW